MPIPLRIRFQKSELTFLNQPEFREFNTPSNLDSVVYLYLNDNKSLHRRLLVYGWLIVAITVFCGVTISGSFYFFGFIFWYIWIMGLKSTLRTTKHADQERYWKIYIKNIIEYRKEDLKASIESIKFGTKRVEELEEKFNQL